MTYVTAGASFNFSFGSIINTAKDRFFFSYTGDNYQTVHASLIETGKQTQNSDQENRRRKRYTMIQIGSTIEVINKKQLQIFNWYFWYRKKTSS